MRQSAFSFLPAIALILALGTVPAFAQETAHETPATAAEASHEATAEAAGHGAEAEGLPQFDTTRFPSQIFWLVITFGLTYVLMRYVALPGVEQTMGLRERRIKADIEEAKSLNEQAKKLAAEYDARLNAARLQAQEVYRLSSEENARKAAARTQAQNEAIEQRLREAEHHIEGLKNAAIAELDTEIEDVVSQLIARVSGQAPQPADVKAAIRAVKGA